MCMYGVRIVYVSGVCGEYVYIGCTKSCDGRESLQRQGPFFALLGQMGYWLSGEEGSLGTIR